LTLSVTLKATNHYSLFMAIVAIAILCGSMLLLRLKRAPVSPD
jgi:hypothetical protein